MATFTSGYDEPMHRAMAPADDHTVHPKPAGCSMPSIFTGVHASAAFKSLQATSNATLPGLWMLAQTSCSAISDWQRQCPRPMVQMKPVTQPADGGKGAIPYWPLDFLFLAPPRAHYIMRCGR